MKKFYVAYVVSRGRYNEVAEMEFASKDNAIMVRDALEREGYPMFYGRMPLSDLKYVNGLAE